jgi:hypothetical protein
MQHQIAEARAALCQQGGASPSYYSLHEALDTLAAAANTTTTAAAAVAAAAVQQQTNSSSGGSSSALVTQLKGELVAEQAQRLRTERMFWVLHRYVCHCYYFVLSIHYTYKLLWLRLG